MFAEAVAGRIDAAAEAGKTLTPRRVCALTRRRGQRATGPGQREPDGVVESGDWPDRSPGWPAGGDAERRRCRRSGGRSLIGALTDGRMPEEHANCYTRGNRCAGAALWSLVKVDESRADRAAEILRANGAIDLDERARFPGGAQARWAGCESIRAAWRRKRSGRERGLACGIRTPDPLSGLPLTSEPERDDRRRRARSGADGQNSGLCTATRPASTAACGLPGLLLHGRAAPAARLPRQRDANRCRLPDPVSGEWKQRRQHGIDRRRRCRGKSCAAVRLGSTESSGAAS